MIAWFGERGISKKELFESYYIDEIPLIITEAKRMQAVEQLTQYRIACAPHMPAEERMKLLNELTLSAQGESRLSFMDERLDRRGLQALKRRMKRR